MYLFVSNSEKIAEAWVLSNRDDGQSIVQNGELKGKTLGKAIEILEVTVLAKMLKALSISHFLLSL